MARIMPNINVTLEKENILQLGKGGWMTPGSALPNPPLFFQCILLKKIGSVFEPSLEALDAAIR